MSGPARHEATGTRLVIRRRLGNAALVLALAFGIAMIVGTLQTPRPAWSRLSIVPLVVLVLVGRWLRRSDVPPT